MENPPRTCPRCGYADAADPACPRCGVVFAKLKEDHAPRPPRLVGSFPAAPSARPSTSAGRSLVLVVAFVIIGAGVVYWLLPRTPAQPDALSPPRIATSAVPPHVTGPLPALPSASPAFKVPGLIAPSPQSGLSEADMALALSLMAKAKVGGPVGPADIAAAEALSARYPTVPQLRELLGGILMLAAQDQSATRRFADAGATYRRAAVVLENDPAPRFGLMNVLLALEDWTGAEAAARDTLSRDARNGDAWEGLGRALFRQDRDREAADALRTALGIRESESARALLSLIEKRRSDEAGMTEQRIAHFHVRYDGEAHEDIGREILRALERHYATLVTTFDYQPKTTIPVILFSHTAYHDAAGAPAWSGGVYDNTDGRIRIPIGGLTASLSPDMDDTLIHEVTHAFVADCTRGAAPRELHEGLAQYLEGKRLTSLLGQDQLRALAEGRVSGVAGFYMHSLSFVEYLLSRRSQGGINDLLKALGETGSVDQSFRRVYGIGYGEIQQAWTERMRQLYGG